MHACIRTCEHAFLLFFFVFREEMQDKEAGRQTRDGQRGRYGGEQILLTGGCFFVLSLGIPLLLSGAYTRSTYACGPHIIYYSHGLFPRLDLSCLSCLCLAHTRTHPAPFWCLCLPLLHNQYIRMWSPFLSLVLFVCLRLLACLPCASRIARFLSFGNQRFPHPSSSSLLFLHGTPWKNACVTGGTAASRETSGVANLKRGEFGTSQAHETSSKQLADNIVQQYTRHYTLFFVVSVFCFCFLFCQCCWAGSLRKDTQQKLK